MDEDIATGMCRQCGHEEICALCPGWYEMLCDGCLADNEEEE